VDSNVLLFIFAFYGPTVWISLPSAVHGNSLSLNTSRWKFRTYLLVYFQWWNTVRLCCGFCSWFRLHLPLFGFCDL